MDHTQMSEALARLAPRLGGVAISDLRRLSGGASQELWAFQLNGAGAPRPLIMRRRPDGMTPDAAEGEGRTVALATEAALITAAGARGAPVPGIVHVCGPDDHLGEAYVMTRVEGEALGRRIVRDAAFAAVRPGLAHRCGEVLAMIHAIPPTEVPPLSHASAADELDRYEAIYRTSGALRPVFELALRRLRAQAPAPAAPVLLHGDFRNGNLMIHPERGLEAVLDWELAHIGDAASDLGWLCTSSWRFGVYDQPVGGFGAYEDLRAGYRAGGGRDIALEEIRYWQMLGSLKWGIMCLIMYSTFASGVDPSVERAMIGRRVSETEIDLINLMEGRA